MKLREPVRFLKQVKTGTIYIRTEQLASRPDMIEFVPEQKQEPNVEPKPEPTPEPEVKAEVQSAPFKIEKAKRANAG